ncbi:MAG: ribosome-associated translation inhibitor RaiA [Verrucomicrobiota bacterium]
MKLILSTHNITLTDAIEDHILNKLEKLDHYDKRALDARVTLEHDHTRVPEKQFSCSIRLDMRGPDLFAEDRERDLYAAILPVSQPPIENGAVAVSGNRIRAVGSWSDLPQTL